MSDRFTRRGFTRAALIAGAGLWLPALPALPGVAQRRLTLVPHAVQRPRPERCQIELFLSHGEGEPVSVFGGAELAGALQVGDAVHAMHFQKAEEERRRMSRVARPARDVPALLASNQRTLYATYHGAWPSALEPGSSASLELRVVLRVARGFEPPGSERGSLAAVRPLRIDVVRPA